MTRLFAGIKSDVIVYFYQQASGMMVDHNLKRRLQEGEVIRYKVGGRLIASMYVKGGRIVLLGLSGRHSIDIATSDEKRIAAHWKAFRETAEVHFPKSQTSHLRLVR